MKPPSSALYAAIACASSLLYLGPASAQDAMPGQLDQLSGFLGDGTCAGHFLAAKSPRATSAKYHGEKILSDRWIMVRYEEETTSSNPRPYQVAQYFGYDAKAGHFIDVVLDNSGASYGTGTSSGWHGDVITFENSGVVGGQRYVFRDVFTRRGTKVGSHAGYQRDQSGKWMKVDEEICKRM